MAQTSCPKLDSCAMFGVLTHSGTRAAWRVLYCTADYRRCERFRTAEVGFAVPDNLMPNGALLRKAKPMRMKSGDYFIAPSARK